MITPTEAVALTLANGDLIESKFGDAISQDIWTSLYERKLIKLCRDAFDEHFTMLTDVGGAALLEYLTGAPVA